MYIKHSFVWRAIFVRINQGTHQGWMPQFQNWNSIKNKIFYFWNGQKKNIFLSLYVFDTNLLNFYSFLRSFDVVICPIYFFIIIILYFVHPQKIIACLLKGKNWRKKCMKIKNKTNKKKMLRVSQTFVWVACYSNCLCSKVHFLWKESKN